MCGVPRVDPFGRTDSKSAQVSRAGWRRLSKGPGEGADIPRLQEGEAGEGRGEEGVSGRMSRIPGFSGRLPMCQGFLRSSRHLEGTGFHASTEDRHSFHLVKDFPHVKYNCILAGSLSDV